MSDDASAGRRERTGAPAVGRAPRTRLRALRRRVSGVRGRTTGTAIVVVGLALAVGAGLLVLALRQSLVDDIESTAALRSSDLAAALDAGSLPASLAVEAQDEGFEQIVDGSGAVVVASANVAGRPRLVALEAPGEGYRAHTLHVLAGESEMRVVARRAGPDGAYTVYVGKSLAPVDRSVDNLATLLLIGFPALLLFVGGVTWVVVGRALRPVEAIRSEVEQISTLDLHRRVPVPDADDEIGSLARTMNAMLERLDAAVTRQRQFAADASHELRSPLAGIRAQIEVDLAHPERADWRATELEVLDETGRMQRLVDDLLVLARLDSSSGAKDREPIDLDDVVLEECSRARVRTSATIDTSAVSGGQVEGDLDQLRRAVRNLLDNAARHASSSVRVSLCEQGDRVVLEVHDDGPGIAEADRDRIFDRFARLDDARARDAGGAGLGLAITRDIVRAHGGTVAVAPSDTGARFVVELPGT